MFTKYKTRIASVLTALLLVGVQTFAPIAAIVPKAAAASAASLDQWANSAPTSWQNGDLNANNSSYREGDSVAFRITFSGIALSSHSVTIQWDTTQGGKHAYDYLTSYNRTVTAEDPCFGVSGCSSPTTYAIPTDPNLTIPQAAGLFTLYNGTITSVSGYTLSGSYSGNSSTSITINFTASSATPVLAWGGHIADENDWGIGNGASAVSGSPYHQRILSLDGTGGNQDRSMKASAVILLPYITITKIVQSGTALPSDFSFNVSPAVNGVSSYSIPTGQNSVSIFNVSPDGNYTITESGPSGYGFVSGTGTSCTFSGSTATASVAQGVAGSVKNASCTFTNGLQTGTITLIKNVINDNGGTAKPNDFGLTIGGTAVTSGQTLTLPTGSYALNEAGLTGYSFVSLTGTGCPTTLGGTVNLTNNANVTCTITNDDNAPSLTLVKNVTNDNGGTAQPTDWTLTATGPTTISGKGGATSGASFKAGTYTLSESGTATGYAASDWTCVGGSQNGSQITLGLGDSATCTITNNDIAPSLTLVKEVSNTHGGTAQPTDWTLTATGPTTISGKGGATSDSSFKAGVYTLSESGNMTGYSASAWTCTNGVTVSNNQITLANGQTTICTIVNSDLAPTLTVIKNVYNPYGTAAAVSSFPLFVTSTDTNTTTQVTSGTPTTQFNAGSYTISETATVSGYTFTGVNGDCTYNANTGIISILLSLGQSSTCTLTNTAVQPELIVKKHVVNTYNGSKTASDFTMTVSGNSPSQTSFAGSETGTTVYLNEGSYSVDELAHAGYNESLGTDCSGTITVGEVKTCTITNTEIAPGLTVVKDVTNSYNGSMNAADFNLYVNNTLLTSPVSSNNGLTATYTYTGVQSNTPYTVSEAATSGYTQDSLVCTDDATNAVVANPVTLSEGQHVTCTITNVAQPATLIVKKVVVNAYGSSAVANDFSFSVNGGNAQNFYATGENDLTVDAGLYTVTEPAYDGFSASYDNCTDVVIANGGTATCTITNTAVAPKLTITKVAYPSTDQSFGFTINGTPFSLTGDGSKNSTTTFSGLTIGDYAIQENTGSDWYSGGMDCNNGAFSDDTGVLTVHLTLGANVTCTAYNFALNTITGHKYEDVNMNGQHDQGEPGLQGWTIQLAIPCDGEEIPSLSILGGVNTCTNTVIATTTTDATGAYSFTDLYPGDYVVCEVQQSGWIEMYPNDTANNNCYVLTIDGNGQTVSNVDFGNFKKGEVTGVKFNDVNGNGKRDAGEPLLKNWQINLTKECTVNAGNIANAAACQNTVIATTTTDANGAYSFTDLEPGTYKVCEVMQDKWKQTFPGTADGCTEFTIATSNQTVTADFGNKPIPQVLGETLVNTGANASTNVILGLIILGTLGALHFLGNRRNSYVK